MKGIGSLFSFFKFSVELVHGKKEDKLVPTRVFLLSKNFPPIICGVGDYTFELYHRLKAKGYIVKIITSKNEEVIRGLSESNLMQDVYPIIQRWNYKCVKQIIALLKKENADWLCINYVPSSLSRISLPTYVIWIVARIVFLKTKSLVFFHEVSIRIFHLGFKLFFVGICQRIIAYAISLTSNKVATSNILYRKYLSWFHPLLIPIPANIYSDLSYDRARNKKVKIVSFLNRCDEFLLRAITQLKNESSNDIEMRLIGKANENHEIKVRKSIERLGLIGTVVIDSNSSKQNLTEQMTSADIYVQIEFVNRYGEGGISTKSGALAAAFAAGLPVISVKGDLTDFSIFEQGKNIIFSNYDSESIAKVLKEIMSSPALKQSLALGARRTYEQKLSWSKTVDSYELLLR